MRSIRLVATAIAICLTASGLLAQQQIVLVATITDPAGAEVANVDTADVEFTENGVAGTVVTVEPVATVVPKIQILVDNGVGIPAASLGDLRTAVKNLLNALPRNVEITLVTTAPQPRTLEKATTDHIKLLSAIDRLTPDGGAGRFVDSLYEATDRINKDKQEGSSYTIISVASSVGDLNFRESDVKTLSQRVAQKRTSVHVVILSSMNSASAGGIQVDLGKGLADMTGGRFETIAVANRLPTLLPEIGAQVAKSMAPGAKQFRITLQRPSNTSQALGRVGLAVKGKLLSNIGFQAK
jgi:hypothetical protein